MVALSILVFLFIASNFFQKSKASLPFRDSTLALWKKNGNTTSEKHVILRPIRASVFEEPVTRLLITISAAQDDLSQQRILASYRLFINGQSVGIGPGRSVKALHNGGQVGNQPNETRVYDVIEYIPKTPILSETGILISLQCYNSNPNGAWVIMEAEIYNEKALLGVIGTNLDWLAFYNADNIFQRGSLDRGSAYGRINENLNAGYDLRELRTASSIEETDLAQLWDNVEERVYPTTISAKKTKPLFIADGMKPISVKEVPCDGLIEKLFFPCTKRYLVDFGQAAMGGLSFKLPKSTIEQLGIISETKLHFKKVNEYVSELILGNLTTLKDDFYFENHEFVGIFRYAELIIGKTNKNNELGRPRSDSLFLPINRWVVHYPWDGDDQSRVETGIEEREGDETDFVSSSEMLNQVWRLCRDTIKYTSLDVTTDSNTRERLPYEADGYLTLRSWYALRADYDWPLHSINHLLNNPTWPTEWKQYTSFLVYEHFLQSGDISLAQSHMDALINNTMMPFLDPVSNLINFTSSRKVEPFNFNSPMCHKDAETYPYPVNDGGVSCDNIDWLPKTRQWFQFTPVNTIINAFFVRALEMLSILAEEIGNDSLSATLMSQANRTRREMLVHMYNNKTGMWCDGVCHDTWSRSTFHTQHYLLWLGLTPDHMTSVPHAYLAKNGIKGSTYSTGSMLHGLFERTAHIDNGQLPISFMTQCGSHSWCEMLNQNATLTWEHWGSTDGTHSHPWSTTPAAVVKNGLVGARPLRKGGWKVWRIRPAIGNLTFVNASLWTPHGKMSVHISQSTKSMSIILDLSRTNTTGMIKGTLCLPLPGRPMILYLDNTKTVGRISKDRAHTCVDLDCLDRKSTCPAITNITGIFAET
eukprot:g3961.t1